MGGRADDAVLFREGVARLLTEAEFDVVGQAADADELLAIAATHPPGLKQRGMSLKRVVVAAMRGLVPDEVMDRPKRGFGVPLDRAAAIYTRLAALPETPVDRRRSPSARAAATRAWVSDQARSSYLT